MELPDKVTVSNDIAMKTVWLLLSIALSAVEMFLPRIPVLPWLKPGLGNIITILWIMRFGSKDAILFSFLRSWITGFYFGFSFTTFVLSLGGGISSTIVMGIVWSCLGKRNVIGTIGLGMIGAFTHNISQLLIIYLTMTHNAFIFYQIPFMCGASLLFGGFIGSSSYFFEKIISTTNLSTTDLTQYLSKSLPRTSHLNAIFSNGIFLFCCALLFVKSLLILFLSAVVTTILVQLITGSSLKKILYPLRFWMLFAFIGIMYLFFSYGTRVNGLSLVTREGIYETAAQFLRLWVWLEASFLLNHFHFHTLFFHLLKFIFPNHTATFKAGLLSMEFFPEMLRSVKNKENLIGLHFFKTPLNSLDIYIKRLMIQIETIITKEIILK